MKRFIDKILDVPKLIRTIWLMLWIILFILLVMKFCFGIWYPIVIKNENFITFNNFLTNSWLKYVIQSAFYLISANLIYLTTCNKSYYNNIYEFIIINLLIVGAFAVKLFYGNYSFIVEFIFLIIFPIIYLTKTYFMTNKAKLILYPIVIQIMVMVWQLNIFFVRNVDFNKLNNESYILGFVLQLDYYIFIIITFIGGTKMGLWSVWFFGKDITSLKAYKEKELSKENPNLKLVAEIDKRIEELEKEGK